MTFFSFFESLKEFLIPISMETIGLSSLGILFFAFLGQILIILYWCFKLNRMWHAQQTFFILDQRIENAMQRSQQQLETILQAHRHHSRQVQEEQERMMLLKEELKILVERGENLMNTHTDATIKSLYKQSMHQSGGYRDVSRFKNYGS
jgi:hypothetical protein